MRTRSPIRSNRTVFRRLQTMSLSKSPTNRRPQNAPAMPAGSLTEKGAPSSVALLMCRLPIPGCSKASTTVNLTCTQWRRHPAVPAHPPSFAVLPAGCGSDLLFFHKSVSEEALFCFYLTVPFEVLHWTHTYAHHGAHLHLVEFRLICSQIGI